MTRGQDPDRFLYIMGSCRDRLNVSSPTEAPTDQHYEDILSQALLSGHEVFEEPISKGGV